MSRKGKAKTAERRPAPPDPPAIIREWWRRPKPGTAAKGGRAGNKSPVAPGDTGRDRPGFCCPPFGMSAYGGRVHKPGLTRAGHESNRKPDRTPGPKNPENEPGATGRQDRANV